MNSRCRSGVKLHLAMRDEAQAAERREQRAKLRQEASAFAASCELHFDRQGNVEENAIAEIKALFKAMDSDGNSKVSSDEFVAGVNALRVDCDPAETFKVRLTAYISGKRLFSLGCVLSTKLCSGPRRRRRWRAGSR